MEVSTTATNSATHTQTYTWSHREPITLSTLQDLFDNARKLRVHYFCLSQKELGKKLECSPSMVSMAENHPEDVSLNYWFKYANLLDLRLDIEEIKYSLFVLKPNGKTTD